VRTFLDFAGKHFAANPSCPEVAVPVDAVMPPERAAATDGRAPAFMKPRRLAI
jgi:hypothetical protein